MHPARNGIEVLQSIWWPWGFPVDDSIHQQQTRQSRLGDEGPSSSAAALPRRAGLSGPAWAWGRWRPAPVKLPPPALGLAWEWARALQRAPVRARAPPPLVDRRSYPRAPRLGGRACR